MKKMILFLFILFAVPVFAESTGTINFTNINVSVVTGLTGYTVNFCNSTANCYGLTCFLDYDDTSSGLYSGWCNSSIITNCVHNGSSFGSGTSICVTNETYRSCTSGVWGTATACSTGYKCDTTIGTPGNCTVISSSSSTSPSSGGSSSTTTTTVVGSLLFTSYPLGFDIVQGDTVIKYATLKNNGNKTLYNVTIEVSGASWYSVEPGKADKSVINNETTFSIVFSPTEDSDVKAYTITLTAKTSDSSVTATNSFGINVKPSNKTVQEQILPEYDEYIITLDLLESRMNQLESDGADVEEVKGLIANAKTKLAEANNSIELKDYFQAKQLLNDAKGVIDAASAKLNEIKPPGQDLGVDYTFFIIIGAVVAIIIVAVYLLLPPKITSAKSWINSSEKKKGLFRKSKKKKE